MKLRHTRRRGKWLSLLLAMAALGAITHAQDTAAVATGSPLVLKTSENELASDLLRKFGGDQTELKDGQMLVLTLDDGGRPQVRIEDGNAGMIELHAQPARLMEVFADKVNEARQMAQGMGTFILSQQGMQPAEAIKVIQGAFDFPTQIAEASLTVHGDPHAPEKGFDGQLSLTPKGDTWLGSFIGGLHPNQAGAPVIGQTGAMLTGAMACTMDDPSILKPLMALAAAMGTKSHEDAEKNIGYMHTAMAASDGTGALSWNPASGGMQMISGLNDAEAIRKLWADEGYRKMAEAQARANPAVEVESDFNAFTHQGVQVAKIVVTMDESMPNPMFKDGRAETYTAITDKYMVMSMFGTGDEGIKQLIDLTAGDVKRQQLGANVIGKLSMRLAEFADHMSDGQAPTDEMPENVDVELSRGGNSLTIKFKAK